MLKRRLIRWWTNPPLNGLFEVVMQESLGLSIIKRVVNRVCKSANPCLFFTKSVDPRKFLFKFETTTTSRNRSVKVQTPALINVNAFIVNFAQTVKTASYLTTVTPYNSSNSLIREFKWDSFEKRNSLDELINIPTKAEGRSIKSRLGPKIQTSRQAQSRFRAKIHSSSTIYCDFKIRKPFRFTARIYNPCAI